MNNSPISYPSISYLLNVFPVIFVRWVASMALIGSLSVQSHAEEVEISLSATVVGNQEQPKILYIVPWKPPEGTARLDRPVSSQLNQVFEHLEPEELHREVRLYQKLDGDQKTNPQE